MIYPPFTHKQVLERKQRIADMNCNGLKTMDFNGAGGRN